jgi:hypothetical protein
MLDPTGFGIVLRQFAGRGDRLRTAVEHDRSGRCGALVNRQNVFADAHDQPSRIFVLCSL